MRSLVLAFFVPALALAAPRLTIKPDSTRFVDDPYALRDDGKALAWIATDGADAATLHLTEFDGGKITSDVKVEKAPPTPTALRWLSPTRVLIVWRDPDSEARYAQVFTAAGPEKERIGPAALVDVTTVEGKAAVVTYMQQDKGKNVEHVFSAYRADTLKALAKKIVKEDRDGMVPEKGGAFHPLWIEHSLTAMVVKREGQYDKARDMKRPDRLARYDVFTGKLRDEQEIADLIAFVHVNADHARHPGEDRFAHIRDDRARLLLVDGEHEREVTLPKSLSMYSVDSLRYQPLDGGRLALSLTIDPLNPPALARKKADPAVLELYVVDGDKVTPRFQLDTGDRPASWQLAGDELVVLRKSKGFDRGGVQLELYDLPR